MSLTTIEELKEDNDLVSFVNTSQNIVSRDADNATLIEMWLHGKSKNTKAAYIQDVQHCLNFLSRTAEIISLLQLTLRQLQQWSDAVMNEASESDATKARRIRSIKSLCSFLFKTGMTRFNVAHPLRVPRIRQTLHERILTPAQIQKLLTVVASHSRDAVLFKLMYTTGCRVSEVCALRWSDFQLRPDLPNNNAQLTLFGKGQKTRVVVITPALTACLQAYREATTKTTAALPAEDWMFPGNNGKSLSRVQIWKIFKRWGEAAGIPHVHPHVFRHSHCSHALAKGASLPLLQKTMGHSNLNTLQTYLHLNPEASSASFLE